MEKLSKNLSVSEVIKSNTAKRLDIDNNPTNDHLVNLKALADNLFQPLRDQLGAISVSSGYRSEALNKAIRGSKTSQHCKGEALDLDNDFKAGRATNAEIFHCIKNTFEFDQLIWEFGNDENPNWVHVSYKKDGKNRYNILVAKKVNGKTKYFNYD